MTQSIKRFYWLRIQAYVAPFLGDGLRSPRGRGCGAGILPGIWMCSLGRNWVLFTKNGHCKWHPVISSEARNLQPAKISPHFVRRNDNEVMPSIKRLINPYTKERGPVSHVCPSTRHTGVIIQRAEPEPLVQLKEHHMLVIPPRETGHKTV